MVSSWRQDGYDVDVKANIKRTLTVIAIVIVIFLVTAVTVFLMTRISENSDRSTIVVALIAGGIVAGLSVPVFIWQSLSPGNPEQYSAYPLEEIDLDEDELTEAVGNWVYARYRRRMEDDARFLEDEDGIVTCRVTVRKD
jgi:hypothetical protein